MQKERSKLADLRQMCKSAKYTGTLMLTLTLPYPPSINHLYAVVKGRKILSAAGRRFQQDAVASIRKQLEVTPSFRGYGKERVGYFATAFMPDNRRRDLSNVNKIVEDVLTLAGIWDDDSQVDYMAWRRGEVTMGGSVFLEIGLAEEFK